MTGEVLGAILPLAIHVVRRLRQDDRAMCPGALAVRPRVGDPHHHVLGPRLATRRAGAAAWLGYDHGPVADPQLSPVVLADPQPLDKPECRSQPGNRLADVRIDQNRDDRGRWDRAVDLHSARLTTCTPAGHGPQGSTRLDRITCPHRTRSRAAAVVLVADRITARA